MNDLKFLTDLEAVIDARMSAPTQTSYTARLVESGPRGVAQKLGEEAVETALAAVSETPERLVAESADLLYHLLVLLKLRDRSLADVAAELEARHRP